MADQIELKVPDVGGEEVEVIEILVSEGDTVEQEDGVVTVESDKASMDIPASSGGKITELKVKVGDTISEGDVLALMEASGGSDDSDESDSDKDAEEKTDEKEAEDKAEESEDKQEEEKEEKDEDSEPEKKSSGGDSKVIDVEVPDIGDEEDVEIIEILVSKGDSVSAEDGLITLETDKATMDVPCPQDGEIEEMLVNVGDKVSQGSVIAKLKVSGGADDSEEKDSAKEDKSESEKESDSQSDKKSDDKGDNDQEKEKGSSVKPSSERQPPVPDHPSQRSDRKEGVLHASPAVRRVAREFGVDLSQVKGSGPKDRILKEDVQDFVKYELSRPKAVAGATGQGGGGLQVIDPPKVDFSKFGEVEEVQLSRIQRKSGPNLHRNWVTIPHVTQFDEADITELEKFRKAENEVAKKQDLGFKITPLVFIMKACAKALREFPTFNSSLSESGESLYMKKYVHIGIAVDTPNGLVVPVIRDVDKKGIYELSEELVEISSKARDGKLKASDMQGGCFSISSLGGIGGTAFTPIVNAPDVAILGVSRNEMKPKWNGQEFEPRLTLPLSLSYDHRVIDGAEAARFTAYLSGVLGDIRKLVL
ncbi:MULTISPECIES: dihydrolipoyllysine-residue acetyltransferase [unclassified Idiomarina]|uniref:dihydrolipoyllysine-residue acetyltransferase n=1 Tax=unclassified Idiomarina TaxID=2614829 RepID=UPI000AB1BDF1|nr:MULTISPECIES: dihydrolipoyllysine-residue acetyltransferase [unclassified Idiomarina]MCJ8316648.1 dihydrolipoyllysine-residue acetyltransferase [Idiomarina sp.]NQZ16470.1 dihydrolipoyllysine-residue acetyltransferase [Idiomarina sp.]|tara:strand:+ start:103477 stop:105252 length:1776 start_codon:yes stop_codon:yes gene_type:complete